MRLLGCSLLLFLAFHRVSAQRYPLDHSVYDGWESIGERSLFPALATITDDSRFAIFQIHPTFKDSRDARIKKKTPEQSHHLKL